ncbi:MAG: hypothetical protein ACI8P0_005383 [Planctomycetaceae bacterium]|jgi:hypothetical protein
MKMRYRIRRWDELFENAQSRKTKTTSWVPVRNKHDGKSFRRVMALPNGPAIYAAWILTLQVASKCPKRGVLADADGPLTAEDLSVKTDCPESLFDEVFAELTSEKISWLEAEEVDDDGNVVAGSESATSPLPEHSTSAGLKGREQNRKEGKRKNRNEAAAYAAGDSTNLRKRSSNQVPVAIPSELDTEPARNALKEFGEHRRQLKRPLTPLAETKLLQEWSAKGANRFVAAVNYSIAQGWQGVFEPGHNGTNRSDTATNRRGRQRPGRVAAPPGKYDDDSDVIDLTVAGGVQ